MTISDDQWSRWLILLEDMLHEADVHQEFLFGIRINAAIDELHMKLRTARIVPRPDQLPSDKRNS